MIDTERIKGEFMKKILIADDAELNREVLKTIFEEQFEVLEAEDGKQAWDIICQQPKDISLVLLDLMMPEMTGLQVMEKMRLGEITDRIPVIMITGEATTESDVKAYELGASDIIYKPFSRRVVMRRALNIIELYEQRADIEKTLEERTKELEDMHKQAEKNNEFLINALSSVVEFRSLESGSHIQRVQQFTKIMLKHWVALYPECGFSKNDIKQMVDASALHDIGKIGISDEILLKPGRLTKEEFEIMKTHTTIGCEILEKFKLEESDFYRYCYDICRYHHERDDGKGYPDHLAGDEIPVWAQVVSVVDVFDALVSPRVYKAPFDVVEACRMIRDGECGTFSPRALACFEAAKFEIIKASEECGRE